MKIIIKPLETEKEAQEKALVHWKSWQETYKGIVSADFLENLTLNQLVESAYKSIGRDWIAVYQDKVVGFVAFGPGRDNSDVGEVYAIYVTSEYHDKKIGYQLMQTALDHLDSYREIYVWVLKENWKARNFYENIGFELDGMEKDLLLVNPVPEVRMTIKNHDK